MKILVDARSLAPDRRVARAAVGLERRGHEVRWLGAPPPGARAGGGGDPGAAGRSAEVVVGEGAPLRAAVAGWLAGVQAMVLDVRASEARRWSLLDRFAWHSIESLALVEAGEADSLSADPGPLERERAGLWPDDPPADRPDVSHPDTEVLERACERSLARHRRRHPGAAVFVDRDGTLVRERGYLADPDGLELLPGVAGALRDLGDAGIPVVVVSNQSGIERGLYRPEQVYATMARLRERLREQGAELAAIHFCPHAPGRGCACRKPGPALLARAAEDLVLSLRDSVMIGDKWSDADAGRAAGATGILVRTGYGAEEEAQRAADPRRGERVFDDLGAAVDWVLGRIG